MKEVKHIINISFCIVAMVLVQPTFGQNKSNRNVQMNQNSSKRQKSMNSASYDRYRTQPVRRHPHYRYPQHRHVVRHLPARHTSIVFRGLPYYYFSGIYYTSYGTDYIVVVPPSGFRIDMLPVGHVRIVIGPSVYFYYSGVYYTELGVDIAVEDVSYEVTTAPVGAVLDSISDEADEISIDGEPYFEHNDVLYKKIEDAGKTVYKVVYSN